MQIPFTKEAFLNVFKTYNIAVWPLQVLFYILALCIIYFTARKTRWSDKLISATLAFFWLWMGIVYHLIFFVAINKAAYLFGLLFIAEAGLLLFYGVIKGTLSFQFHKNKYGFTGILLILFALLIYPIIGNIFGHVYPYNPGLGLPCPTTIFTLGLLICTTNKQAGPVLVIPVLWSVIGFTAALKLGIYEDTGLLVSGFTALVFFRLKNKA